MSNLDQFFLKSRRQQSVSTRRTIGKGNTLRFITSHTVEATTPDEMEEALNLPETRSMIEGFLSSGSSSSPGGQGRGITLECIVGANVVFSIDIIPGMVIPIEQLTTFATRCREAGGEIRVSRPGPSGGTHQNGAATTQQGSGITLECIVAGNLVSSIDIFPGTFINVEELRTFATRCREAGGEIRVSRPGAIFAR